LLNLTRIIHADNVPGMDHLPVTKAQADVTPFAVIPTQGPAGAVEEERPRGGWLGRVIRSWPVERRRFRGAITAEDLDPVGALERVLDEGEATQRVRRVAEPFQRPIDGPPLQLGERCRCAATPLR
jgi:hypothetical protein